jgi:hypothetical protein
MSWSISTTLERKDTAIDAAKEVDKLRALDRSSAGNQQCESERDEQIEAAIAAAFQLFAHPVFANAAEIGVSLSGHANPEHKTQSGWSNESINVSVFVKSYRAES